MRVGRGDNAAVTDVRFHFRDDGVIILPFSQAFALPIVSVESREGASDSVGFAPEEEIVCGQGLLARRRLVEEQLAELEVIFILGDFIVVVASSTHSVGVGVCCTLFVDQNEFVVVEFESPPGPTTSGVFS